MEIKTDLGKHKLTIIGDYYEAEPDCDDCPGHNEYFELMGVKVDGVDIIDVLSLLDGEKVTTALEQMALEHIRGM